jgi:hypothetical protein
MKKRNKDYLIDLTRMRLASPDELVDLLEKETWPVLNTGEHKREGRLTIKDFIKKYG